MKTSENIVEIAKALAGFQSEVKQPEKDGNNPHFKSKYVTLDGTVKAINECAPKHGLSYTQMPVSDATGIGVVTIMFHSSGQFFEFDPFILPLDKKTAQGVGSALTYAKRYSLSAAFGIVSDVDDDGNEASDNAPQKQSSGSQQPLASEKQLNLINKLLKDVSTDKGISVDAAYKTLKDRFKKDMEWYTIDDASQAITLLNKSLNKGA
ncbi:MULTISPECIES: ERF family protein [Peribacillus]|uniref:ERF family protein n=1 Tax=Peribacillus TaxID=2675229 RepID=UPI001F4E6FE0|nr:MULTISPECIES: ERF family protein [unclassified Peribacillus]MCK1982186.1 ERF family protein [Peribacillus sp. Aquil_B1]MCK2007462.1 ERF family protein [Peribacillus sp. Aquil_B8]